MQIKDITICNFRSFSEKAQTIKFGNGINTIVGENNVGKSNILRAIELCFNNEIALQPIDFFKGESIREIEISISIVVKPEVLSDIFDNTGNGKIFRPLEEINPEKGFKFSFSSKFGRSLSFPTDWLTNEERQRHQVQDRYGDVRQQNFTQFMFFIHTQNTAEKSRRQVKRGKFDEAIVYGNDINVSIIDNFSKQYKNFSEQRKCPLGNNTDVLESFDGSNLADVLSNLKNGDLKQKELFKDIQAKFSIIFPELRVDTVKKGNEIPTIAIEKKIQNQERPISFSGSAVWEMLILITHLISFEGIVFGIDTPELHCHPHIKRCLMNMLKELSSKNQFIVVTHSTTFIDPELIENISVAREVEGSTTIRQLSGLKLDNNQKKRIIRLLNTQTKDLFFSRKVLLVEGETEYGAMPIFSNVAEKNFDINGISIIQMGGSDFNTLIDVLEAFGFKYLIMTDRDAALNITGKISHGESKINTSRLFTNLDKRLGTSEIVYLNSIQSKILPITENCKCQLFPDECFDRLREIAANHNIYVLPSDFEGILKKNGYSDIFKDAKESTGSNSKVIIGRYIAERITEGKDKAKIPEDFRNVINLIVDKRA